MSFSKLFKSSIAVAGLASVGSVALTVPAHAFSFGTWTPYGDVVQGGNTAVLTNVSASDDLSGINVSGHEPFNFFLSSFEADLGLMGGALGSDAIEGSAIRFSQVAQAGDSFSFSWVLSTLDVDNIDRAFVSISDGVNETIFNLTGSPSFSHSFTDAGTYTIGIGVLDIDDSNGESLLALSNANYTAAAVPTPALLPGLIGMGVAAFRKKRQTAAAE